MTMKLTFRFLQDAVSGSFSVFLPDKSGVLDTEYSTREYVLCSLGDQQSKQKFEVQVPSITNIADLYINITVNNKQSTFNLLTHQNMRIDEATQYRIRILSPPTQSNKYLQITHLVLSGLFVVQQLFKDNLLIRLETEQYFVQQRLQYTTSKTQLLLKSPLNIQLPQEDEAQKLRMKLVTMDDKQLLGVFNCTIITNNQRNTILKLNIAGLDNLFPNASQFSLFVKQSENRQIQVSNICELHQFSSFCTAQTQNNVVSQYFEELYGQLTSHSINIVLLINQFEIKNLNKQTFDAYYLAANNQYLKYINYKYLGYNDNQQLLLLNAIGLQQQEKDVIIQLQYVDEVENRQLQLFGNNQSEFFFQFNNNQTEQELNLNEIKQQRLTIKNQQYLQSLQNRQVICGQAEYQSHGLCNFQFLHYLPNIVEQKYESKQFMYVDVYDAVSMENIAFGHIALTQKLSSNRDSVYFIPLQFCQQNDQHDNLIIMQTILTSLEQSSCVIELNDENSILNITNKLTQLDQSPHTGVADVNPNDLIIELDNLEQNIQQIHENNGYAPEIDLDESIGEQCDMIDFQQSLKSIKQNKPILQIIQEEIREVDEFCEIRFNETVKHCEPAFIKYLMDSVKERKAHLKKIKKHVEQLSFNLPAPKYKTRVQSSIQVKHIAEEPPKKPATQQSTRATQKQAINKKQANFPPTKEYSLNLVKKENLGARAKQLINSKKGAK